MSLTAAQQAMRKTGLGASECGVVLGLSTYVDPVMLYLQKKGMVTRPQTSEQRLGHLLEPVVDTLYQERNEGLQTIACEVTLRHPTLPWVLATPDRFCAVGRTPQYFTDAVAGFLRSADCDFDFIAQYKSARWQDAHDWGPEGTDEVPLNYFAQVQWEMAVTSQTRCDLAVLVAGSEMRVYRVAFNEQVFAKLVEANGRFWHDHVLADRPPPLDGGKGSAEHLRLLYPKEKPKTVLKVVPELQDTIDELRRARAEIKRLSVSKKLCEQVICAAMGDAEKLVGEGFSASWKTQQGKVSWKAATEDALDIQDRALTQLRAGRQEDALVTLEGIKGLRERNASAPARAFRTTFSGDDGDDDE